MPTPLCRTAKASRLPHVERGEGGVDCLCIELRNGVGKPTPHVEPQKANASPPTVSNDAEASPPPVSNDAEASQRPRVEQCEGGLSNADVSNVTKGGYPNFRLSEQSQAAMLWSFFNFMYLDTNPRRASPSLGTIHYIFFPTNV